MTNTKALQELIDDVETETTSTITFTFDKTNINPAMVQIKLWEVFDLLDVEVLQSVISNVTEEEDEEAWG
jgi:hypothetical protein